MATATRRTTTSTVAPELREQFAAEASAQSQALERRVRELKDASVDAKVDTRLLRMEVSNTDDPKLGNRVVLAVPSQQFSISISDTAHDQIAGKLGIPRPYYDRMLEHQPQLLADNVNTWFHREPEKRLVRMLSPTNAAEHQEAQALNVRYRARGFLSATYRPLDNPELLATVLPVASRHGAYLRDFSLDDQRLHARFATFERSADAIVKAVDQRHGITELQARGHHRVNGRDVTFADEVIRMGFSIRNSETGFASLDVSGFVEILKCLNGLIVPAQVKQRHVGGKRNGHGDEPEVEWLSEQTQRLDNAAIFSRVHDAVEATLEEEAMAKSAATILSAKAEVLALPAPVFEFLGRIGEQARLTDGELALLRTETERAVIEEGGTTRFALSQGWTAAAKQLDTFDKRTEWERTGFQWLADDTTALLAAGREPTHRPRYE